MKKVSLLIHQNYVEKTIETLHEKGLMEIIDVSREDPETLKDAEKASMPEDTGLLTTYELRLTRLIDILKRFKKAPHGLRTLLRPQIAAVEKKMVPKRSIKELFSCADDLLKNVEKNVLEKEEKLRMLDEQGEKIRSDIIQVSYLKDFKLDLSDIGESIYTVIKAGITSDLSDLQNSIKQLDTGVVYHKQFGTRKKRQWAVVIAAHISEKKSVEKICREKMTTEFDFKHLSGPPKDAIKSLEKEEHRIKDEKKKMISALSSFAEKRLQDLLTLREEIQIERIRKEVLRNFAKTSSTFIIKGWVLEKDEKDLKKIVDKVSNGHVVYSSEKPSVNPDSPPTFIETPWWAASFKTFLKLFSTPKYNEINPTIFMGIFFILFFGVMLGDAGYGLVILILSIFAYYRFSKHSSFIKNWSFLGICLGATTTIAGLLTNSFFGDFIPRFVFHNPDQLLYSISIMGIHLPVDSLSDPITILSIALILGLIHLNLGVLLGIYQSYRQRNIKSMLTKHFCWIPLQIGGGMLIGHFILDWNLESIMLYIAGLLTLVGLLLLFMHAGPVGFFDITGYVGDWLSYARLLALGLATAGMALAFNVVGELIPKIVPVVGIILFPIILTIAHIANLGIQALGAAVHSLRLQYVEFFNRFYEGGGREYMPFKTKRKYTKLSVVDKKN